METNDNNDKKLKGFALNPEGINLAGRPKGSRNKTTLLKAQLQLDDSTEAAAEFLDALLRNDKELLGIKDDVPLVLRHKAAVDILNKAIANEKDKEPVGEKLKEIVPEAKKLFSPRAVD